MEYTFNQIAFAFLVTLFAGLCTSVGSAIAFLANSTNKRFLSVALGFSAGVMIYVSFAEILVKGKDILIAEYGKSLGSDYAVIAFFFGILLTAFIDRLIPDVENPHEPHSVEELTDTTAPARRLMRMGLFCALALSLHNFPEGMATFIATLDNPQVGLMIAMAIAIHNIPEGIAVSVPIYQATGSRKKAFWYSTVSGLAEPCGALLCYLILMPYIGANPSFIGILFAVVAGIMIFISLDELLPAAKEYGEHHLAIYGLVAGMGVMAVSLLLFI